MTSDYLSVCRRCLLFSIFVFLSLNLTACLSLDDLPEMIRPEAEPTAPPATLTPTVNSPTLNAYFSALHGVALRYPVAWEVQEAPYLALASDPDLFEQLEEEAIDLSSGDFEGVIVSVVPATEDLLSADDPAVALTELVEAETDAEVFGRAQALSLGGQDGASMTGRFEVDPEGDTDTEEGTDVVALFALIRSRDGGVVVTGVTSQYQEDRAALEGVIESVIVSQSTQNRSFPIFPVLGAEIEADFEPTPAGPVLYRPADRSFQVTHPADWLVADEDEGGDSHRIQSRAFDR